MRQINKLCWTWSIKVSDHWLIFRIFVEYIDLVVLEERKAHPTDKKDLLTLMLTGKDKDTGLGLPEDNIKKNVRTELYSSTFRSYSSLYP